VPVKEVMPVEVRPVGIAPIVNPVEAAITVTAAVEDARGMIAAAMKRDTTAVEAAAMKASSTMEAAASSTVEASTSMETATSAAAMPDLGCQAAGCGFHGRGRAWARQRQCLGALLRCRRDYKYRGSGNTETAKQPASKIRALHPSTLPETGSDDPEAALQRVLVAWNCGRS
jgi:hypothetical protein